MVNKLGIIGGSGFSNLHEFRIDEVYTLETPYGKSSDKYVAGKLNDLDIVFLPRHGADHSIPPHKINYRANLYGFKQLKVSEIVSITAVGGISENCQILKLVVPDNLIDYTWGREHTFYEGDKRSMEMMNSFLDHIDFTQPFNGSVRKKIISASKIADIPIVKDGVYAVTQGPRLETAAEIEKLKIDGADIVGMTAMPEAALARELGIPYANLSMVVNLAAGMGSVDFSLEEIIKNLEIVGQDALKVILNYKL